MLSPRTKVIVLSGFLLVATLELARARRPHDASAEPDIDFVALGMRFLGERIEALEVAVGVGPDAEEAKERTQTAAPIQSALGRDAARSR